MIMANLQLCFLTSSCYQMCNVVVRELDWDLEVPDLNSHAAMAAHVDHHEPTTNLSHSVVAVVRRIKRRRGNDVVNCFESGREKRGV